MNSDVITPDLSNSQGHALRPGGAVKEHASHPATPTPPVKPARAGGLLFIVALVFAGALVFGLVPRLKERHQVAEDTKELADLNVAVVSPVPAKAGSPLVLSGELKPAIEASIFARANGYVRRWLVDLGAHVEAGQLLAELDTPETTRSLNQARAELLQTQAARDLAQTTAKRWKEMLMAKTVSAQEADEKASDLELKRANVEAAQANVERLEEVSGFSRITAPFTGIITVRALDVGQLVNAGEGKELFRLAQTDKLRVFVRVPQAYARGTTAGQTAELTLPELPGRKFEAKVIRTAGALDNATRTLLTELEVDNSKGEILAGSYANVRLSEAKPEATITLPSNTLLFRAEGTQVAVVVNNKVSMRTVTLGRDFGSSMEIRDGVQPGDKVVTNPSDAIAEGVTVKTSEAK